MGRAGITSHATCFKAFEGFQDLYGFMRRGFGRLSYMWVCMISDDTLQGSILQLLYHKPVCFLHVFVASHCFLVPGGIS